MSDNKRYYWLKLNEDFFEDDTIQWIEEQENGKDYVIFYLKLCLKSLKDDGRLIRYVGERLMPYDVKALSKLTNTSADTVAVAMKTFSEIGLVEMLDTGELYMKQINEMIGTETEVAKRVRKHRAKQSLIKEEDHKALQCNVEETKCNTEKEIEKEIEKEVEKEDNTLSSKHDDIPYREIVDYLNEKTGSQYKHTTQSTRNGIKARYNEGFNLDDFKRVIDIKTSQWLYDTKMKQYLRPQTLFGTKFEAYLNEQLNVYQFEDSMKRDEKEPTPEEIAEFEKAREQFDKYKRTYAQNQS